MEDKIVIEITRSNVHVLDKELGTSKVINKDDLLNLLAISNEGQKLRTGRLPENVLDVGIEEPRHIRKVLLFWKKGRFDFKFGTKVYKDVEFPSMLFMFKIEGVRIVNTYIYALKDINNARDITSSTILYSYPFSNVYATGNICWGSNKLPEINSLHQVSGLPFLFIDSNNNRDLIGNYDSNKPIEEILEMLSKREIGIDEILLPKSLTYGDFCNEHLGMLV